MEHQKYGPSSLLNEKTRTFEGVCVSINIYVYIYIYIYIYIFMCVREREREIACSIFSKSPPKHPNPKTLNPKPWGCLGSQFGCRDQNWELKLGLLAGIYLKPYLGYSSQTPEGIKNQIFKGSED